MQICQQFDDAHTSNTNPNVRDTFKPGSSSPHSLQNSTEDFHTINCGNVFKTGCPS